MPKPTETDRARDKVLALITKSPGTWNLTLLQEELRGAFSQASVARALTALMTEGNIYREGSRKGVKYFPVE